MESNTELKIYTFKNKIHNYCQGRYYFAATDINQAMNFAVKFAFEHNTKVEFNLNYTIEFDYINMNETSIQPGYIEIR